MPSIVYRSLAKPAQVLQVVPSEAPDGKNVLIRVAAVPLHPGDLLGVEGAGVISAIGPDVDPTLGLKAGDRVTFFPVSGAWSDHVVASSLVPLPDGVSNEVGAQMLINTITANLVARTGNAALPKNERTDIVVIQNGAGLLVWRLLSKGLSENGATTIRLVRSTKSAEELRSKLAVGPVFATEEDGWKDKVRAEIGSRRVNVAFDGVVGPLLADVVELVVQGATVVNYGSGSRGGITMDIRLLVPHAITLKGVSMGRWGSGTRRAQGSRHRTRAQLRADRSRTVRRRRARCSHLDRRGT
ncbi:zinc-binding dehydrogenase [Agrobacterium tumefaciens]|uniref:zinc-binding dehydrogenase n=1 Tax=Agrobacterium tumefaciens TaxID=358 RepID=UPI001571AE99|nr:zinc-binding dehydrogenase [Agrobacterium tumefaciens]